ncbi:hypothetical protein LGD11_005292, partial [Escherichia coli]|nr:hypothetical protein [Escherichia coli]EIE2141427.1 hypothetical protein [Escherichia coli]EIG8983936.1 hypothetical protein [Escherichia coli]EIG9116037.1 hypothetical protein [Escherichia coli]EJX5453990.1 hypothetical protein [Escherichia coli]
HTPQSGHTHTDTRERALRAFGESRHGFLNLPQRAGKLVCQIDNEIQLAGHVTFR